jgi:putative ABC transport system permease protein
MARTVWSLERVDPGFQTGGLLTFRVELGWRAYDSHEKVHVFQQRMLDDLAALPGVDAVGFDWNLALSGKARDPEQVAAAGQSLEAEQRNPFVHWHVVSPGYFDAMRIPILMGRALTGLDTNDTRPVALVSQRLAALLWPNQDPIGKQIKGPGDDAWLTVVGVTGNVQHQQLGGETSLDVYRSFQQIRAGGGWFVLRTHLDPARFAQSAPALVPAIDPNQSYFDVRIMTDRIKDGIWQQRTAGALFLGFAAIAVLLATVGLYSVLSYLVSQQQRELGVRIALGAQRWDVLRLVIGRGLRLTLIGLGLGLICAVPLARVVGGLLYGVSPFDPATFVGVPMLLTLLATVACYLPARRAMATDPIIALRAE